MTTYPEFSSVRRIAVIGTGTIGASWAAYFLAQGYDVSAWDPGEGWRERFAAFLDNAWPQLTELGLAEGADRSRVTLHDSVEDAVAEAGFVQESAPERLEVKQELYRRLDNALPAGTVLSSSTSGLIMSDMQAGLATASRFVVGHPFNPPHLIPLVEVVAGKDTDPAAADWMMGFYKHIGKHSIRIRREVPGHLANRLQAALWREAVFAVENDLASVEDIDAAISQGPGLRWALMGPHMILNLAGGKGGMDQFLHHFLPGMQSWWETMGGNPTMDDGMFEALKSGVREEAGDRAIDDLEEERDERLIRLLKILKETERSA